MIVPQLEELVDHQTLLPMLPYQYPKQNAMTPFYRYLLISILDMKYLLYYNEKIYKFLTCPTVPFTKTSIALDISALFVP